MRGERDERGEGSERRGMREERDQIEEGPWRWERRDRKEGDRVEGKGMRRICDREQG
jgi:hypothetical protein